MNHVFDFGKNTLFKDNVYRIDYYLGKLIVYYCEQLLFSVIVVDNLFLRFFLRFRLLLRLLRLEPDLFKKITDNTIIFTFRGGVYRIDILKKEIVFEHSFRKEMSRPLDFCVVKDVYWCAGQVLYGEYFQNIDKMSVYIYSRSVDGKWKIVFEFEKNTINHIHNIVVDKYRNSLIVLTGDLDCESFFWEFRDSFFDLHKVCGGNQSYRSCNLFPSFDGWLFASDSTIIDNYIYFLENPGLLNSRLFKLHKINGPSIYSINQNDNYFFSTSVEPNVRYSGIKYLLTRSNAQSIKENCAVVYYGNINRGFKVIYKMDKDILPAGLFQFGNIKFLHLDLLCKRKCVFIRSVALKGTDGKTSVIYL